MSDMASIGSMASSWFISEHRFFQPLSSHTSSTVPSVVSISKRSSAHIRFHDTPRHHSSHASANIHTATPRFIQTLFSRHPWQLALRHIQIVSVFNINYARHTTHQSSPQRAHPLYRSTLGPLLLLPFAPVAASIMTDHALPDTGSLAAKLQVTIMA